MARAARAGRVVVKEISQAELAEWMNPATRGCSSAIQAVLTISHQIWILLYRKK
jgi:hypothetical protein